MELLVFGMDGASREYIEEAIDRGLMPNTEKFIEEGCFGVMDSVVPPVTIPAWVSMFSGLEPDKLGTCHSYVLNEEYEVVPKSSQDWQGKMLWDRVEGEFGLINVPSTSPVWPVNGYVVEGFPNVEQPNLYPEELEEEFPVPDFIHTNKATKESRRQAYNDNFEKRKEWFSKIDWDCDIRVEVYQLTDTNAHRSKNFDQVMQAYGKVDEMLGKRMEEYDNVMLVSDHGFMHIDHYFYVNTWLREKGYLEEEDSEVGLKQRVQNLLAPLAETSLRPLLKLLNDLISSKAGVDFAPKGSHLESIDFERTEAFSYLKSTSNFGDININDSRWSEGTVENTEELKKEIQQELQEEDFVDKVWRREEIYDEGSNMPDIIVKTREGVAVGPPLFSKYLFETDAFVHKRPGVYGGKGPIFAEGDLERADIIDVAPTLAYYLGQQMDCDGEVLEEIFAEDFDPVEVEVDETRDIDF